MQQNADSINQSNSSNPTIWVDADACPGAIKQILFKAAERCKIQLTLIANQFIPTPKSAYIHFQQVAKGFDIADHEIARQAQPGDLVITSDIPLAAEVMEKGALSLNHRGEMFNVETIKAKLTMRDFMDTMRASGVHTSGPPPLGDREKRLFAQHLDRFLARVEVK